MSNNSITSIVEDKLVKEVLRNYDFSSVKKEIEVGIKDYFESDQFRENIFDALDEEGVGYAVADAILPQLKKALKAIKMTVSV